MDGKRSRIISASRSYIGYPWKHNQQGYALDCFRFWQKVAEDAGIEITTNTDFYSRREPITSLKQYLDSNFIIATEIDIANLVLFEFSGCGHLGIISLETNQGWQFIHASNTKKEVTESHLNQKYLNKIDRIYQPW